jgi:hypothetical protein
MKLLFMQSSPASRHFSLLGPDILLSALFTNTFNIYVANVITSAITVFVLRNRGMKINIYILFHFPPLHTIEEIKFVDVNI